MRKVLRYVVFLLAVATGLPAFAGDVNVQNATELKNAIDSATTDKTIVLKNDINSSGIGVVSVKSKNITIDGKSHGITSSRNFALYLDLKTNLTIKNVGQVDKDYNIISSFNNNYFSESWGGPITTQNMTGAVTHYDNAKLTIENSVFSNNFSPVDGGVLGLQTIDFDVQDSVFIKNSSGQEGGAIWAEVNHGNIENSYFKGNFVRAKGANTSIGGAIAQYGYYADRPSYINNISGTFIENYSYNFGGAIANRAFKSAAAINKINADFSSNYAIQTGGAILNAAGTINTIEGTFTKNYLLNTSTSTGNVRNSTLLQNNSFGGAIANTATGGNEATNDSLIKSISGDFIGNFINTKNGKAYGGAIYNTGTIEDISGTFEDNYVFSEGTSANLALGGAIYSTKDLTITSGKSGTLFSGNYTLQNAGERNYNAIYIDNANATLNLTPKSGKTIRFDDNIDGVAGYNVNIESEYGGTLKLYNDIKNANITTNDVNIDFVDSKYHNYEFLSLNSSDTTNYLIDFKLDKTESNMQSDTITITNTSATPGYVTLSDIHFIADKTDGSAEYYNGTYYKQILFNGVNGNLQLVLGENLQQTQHKIISTAINDTINPITNASDKYYKNIYTGDLSSSIELATKDSTDDSIKLTINGLEWSDDVHKESLGDTFALWLDLETAVEKEFRLAANEQYKINKTLNTASKGKLSVIGQSNISSVIDVNNKALFDLSKKSDLTLKDVRIISAVSDRGSVVKAINQNSSVIIDNASFLNNIAAAFGGVLFNASTSNAKINGIFNANMAGSSGGAIYNQGNIDSIKGEFTSNHTTNSWATGKVVGGAIANKGGTINSITADFNSNYSDQYGGAIANFGENDVSPTINSISGNFNNNYIVVNNSEAFGGAIYNNKIISSITGDFISNHIAQDNLDKVAAKGGAIYNEGTNGLVISGNFLDNYISVNSSSSALGGAIYTKMNTSIVADNGQNALFKGNYVQIGNNKNDNAIYVDNAYATLTLNATNHGVISLYDNIDGTEGYDVLITGDNTGVIGLYNNINKADVKAGKASISLVDGITKNYTFKSLDTTTTTESNIAKWNIDVDLTTGKADTITTADSSSKGTVLLNNFNIIGSTEQDSLIIQILKNTTENDNLQLKIADGVLNVVTDVTNIGNEVFSSKSYLKQEDGISLATTTTTNDSIKFLKDGFYDALQLINQKETKEERKFKFDTAGTHTLLENLGETKSGTLSINGYSNDSSVSVIDLAGKTGFELANGNTTINLNNATLTDSASTNPVIKVTSENNIINLNNAQLKGNIVSETNSYNLNFSGSNVVVDGMVEKANAVLNDALSTLTFNTDTFANANFSALKGTINLQDSAINNYNIGTLKSDINTLYNIDVDAFNKTSDTIKAGENSTGVVKIGSINFLNGITPQNKDFKVQILDTTSTLKLSLSDAIINQLYNFGQVTDTVKDTITTTVNFDDRFYESVKDFVIKGHLSVLDDNKSIGFKDEDMQKVAIAVKEQELLDSLHELSNLNASGKEFNFKTADDVYGVMTDIGTVVNDLTINGVADSSKNKLSVIGIDNNGGFILDSDSTLNISNVNLRGTNSVITNNGGTLNFNNKNIVNGKMDGTGTATNHGDLYIGASNIGLTIDNKNKLYLSEGTLNSKIEGDGTTIINGDVLTLGKKASISGTLNLNNKSISTVDGSYTNYIINSITGDGKATIDVDWANSKADTFQSTSGTGTIALTLDATSTAGIYETKTIKITSGGVGISLTETTGTKTKTETGIKNLTANVNWADKFGGWKREDTYSEKITGVKSSGSSVIDSIQYEIQKTNVGQIEYTDNLDTLALIVQNVVTGSVDKSFTTTDANAIYDVTLNLGTLADNLTIAGVKNGENISTINIGDKEGITVNSANSLTIKDTKITSEGTVVNAESNNAQTTLDNAQIEGNIVNAGNLTLKGNTNATNISGTGSTVVKTLANAQIASLTQNTLSNSGNLTADKLAISTSATNSGTLTNNGTSSINALTNNIGATINGNGSLTLSGASENKGSITQKNLIISGTAASRISTYALRSRSAIAGSFTNSGTVTAENIENNGDIDNTSGTLIGKLTNNGTISGGNITAKDGTINTGSITSANLSVEKGFDNKGNVSGTINISNSGNLVNNGTISGDVTNGGIFTSSLDTISGIIVNNSMFKTSGGTLNTLINGTGTTEITGNVNINGGSFGTTQSVSVLENSSLNIGSQIIEVNSFTLKGTLDIAVTNLVKNSSVYEGGQVLVNNADLSGGKLSFTIAQGLLNKGEKTGDLSVISLTNGATGSISGDVSSIFENNNRYEIQQGSSLGTIIIKNKASGAEVASQIGNQNNRNTADAWDKVVFASNTPASKVQEVLNTLSQHNKEGYRQALNQVAPSDSQFKLETTRMVQNIISKETTHRFEEEGCTCGEVFKRSSMWMQAIGGYNKQSDSFEHQGFKSHTTGYILGYDGSINCGTSLGFGYAYAKSKGKSHSKDMNISSHNVFVYGKYQPLFSYVRGALLYGLADNREKTAIGKYGVSSNYDTHYIGAETYVGYEYLNGITPEMGVRYTYLMPDDYTDSLGQKVKNKDISALTLATRLNYEKKFKLDNGIHVKPEIYAGVTYDLNDTGTTSNVTLGTETYSIRAYRVSRFGTEAGIKMSISKENTDVILGYDTSIKKGYIEHTGMLKLRYNF